MTLEEAYIMRKQENMALKRENAKLTDTVEKLRKGAYSDPDRIDHIKQISALSRKLQEKDRIIDRYRKMYEEDQLKVYELIDKNIDLEEKIKALQWKVESAQDTTVKKPELRRKKLTPRSKPFRMKLPD